VVRVVVSGSRFRAAVVGQEELEQLRLHEDSPVPESVDLGYPR
jgi:hypothetical protein